MEKSKHQSAKIFAFPIARRHANKQKQALASANELESAKVNYAVDFGSCWYHDEAVSHVQSINKK